MIKFYSVCEVLEDMGMVLMSHGDSPQIGQLTYFSSFQNLLKNMGENRTLLGNLLAAGQGY